MELMEFDILSIHFFINYLLAMSSVGFLYYYYLMFYVLVLCLLQQEWKLLEDRSWYLNFFASALYP